MRPMREIGRLIIAFFNPPPSGNFWIRIDKKMKTQEDKNNLIYSTIELLNLEIEVDDKQNTKY